MKQLKKSLAYVLAFITVFSSFTILPSEFWGLADVSAVELSTEEPNAVENNKAETAVSECRPVYTYNENGFIYTLIDDDKAQIVGYNGTSRDIVIPDMTMGSEDLALKYRKVTAIADYANIPKNLTSVTFGKNLETIGISAFEGNTLLKTIDLSVCKNLRFLENYAFKNNTSVTSIIFPDSLRIIDENVFENCDSITEVNLGGQFRQITFASFSDCDNLSTVNIKFGDSGSIWPGAFGYNKNLHTVNIEGDNNIEIWDFVFIECPNLKNVTLGKGVNSILDYTFENSPNLSTIKLLSTDLEHMDTQCIDKSKCTFYCYENTKTHTTLVNSGFTSIKFFEENICTTDIKVNGTSIDNFNSETKEYTAYVDNVTKVNIVPTIKQTYANYKVTNENNVYTLDILDENKNIVDTYKITVEKKAPEPQYTVIGDVTLTLDKISATKVGGSVALPKGTYRLKLAKDDIEFGYSKRVKDYCSLTLSEKYKGFITFDTTGGTYTFQFDTTTNKMTIKHDSYLPNEYLIGDIDTILKPVGDRPLSIGTQQLPEGTYKFKLSIGGKKHGYNKVVDNATVGSLTVNSKFSADITLNATGGMYTFILNTETNKLIIRHTPTNNEDTTDVHISGTFNLVLNDKSATGKELTTATGTIHLEDGCYTFKVYNYGTVYTANAVINDKATKNLSSKYTTPVTLNATGGTYRFTFNKTTGALTVSTI